MAQGPPGRRLARAWRWIWRPASRLKIAGILHLFRSKRRSCRAGAAADRGMAPARAQKQRLMARFDSAESPGRAFQQVRLALARRSPAGGGGVKLCA